MLGQMFVTFSGAVISTLLSFIGANTPDRTAPLTWPEVTANVPGMAAAGDPNARAMTVVDGLIAAHGPDAECDRWCLNVALAQDAYWRGDKLEVIRLAFDAYRIPEQAAHGTRTMLCESGLSDDTRRNRIYVGWGQQDPRYWAGRAAAAGFAGWSIDDPVAQSFVMAHMIASGSGWGHWPVCQFA